MDKKRHKLVDAGKLGSIELENWREYPDHYTACLWPSNLPSKPSDYGIKSFHGRTHPEIIFVALDRYTQGDALVWDPMAGSGTTFDVCSYMGIDCIASDLMPIREEIIQADAALWRPEHLVDLVIYHPPYLDIIEWEGDGSLAVGDVKQYVEMNWDCVDNIYKAMVPGSVLVSILGQVYKGKTVIPLDSLLYPLFSSYFRLLGRVMRPFGETKGGKVAKGNKNRNLWKYRHLKSGLWFIDMDVVCFWQKPLKEVDDG